MLIRGQTTEQRIAEIANAFKQGIDGYSAGQRRYNESADKIDQRDKALEAKRLDLDAEAKRRQEALDRETQKEQNAKEQKATSDALAYSNDVFNKTGKIVDPASVRPLILKNDLAGIGDILKSAPTQPIQQTRAFQEKAALESLRSQNRKPVLSEDQKVTQKQVEKIATDNAQLFKVSSAMREALNQLNDPNKSEEEKIKAGQGLLKLLNSAEGSDAVGAEEAQRLGSFLEFQKFNITNPGPMFGRDIPGFTQQVKNYADLLDGRIARGEEAAKGLRSGKSLSEMTAKPVTQTIGTQQAAPVNQNVIQQVKAMSDEDLLKFVQGN